MIRPYRISAPVPAPETLVTMSVMKRALLEETDRFEAKLHMRERRRQALFTLVVMGFACSVIVASLAEMLFHGGRLYEACHEQGGRLFDGQTCIVGSDYRVLELR